MLPSGNKKFVLQYRYGRISRRMGLGRYGAINVEQARSLAFQALAKLHNDIDPLAEQKERRTALTVKDLAPRSDEEHILAHLKETTAKEYRRKLLYLVENA